MIAAVEPGRELARSCYDFEKRGDAMIRLGMAAFVLMLTQVAGASAAERSTGLLHHMSCTVVRYYVAKYSEPAAEAWARGKGATDADIEAARHCLPGGGATQTVQAANWAAR